MTSLRVLLLTLLPLTALLLAAPAASAIPGSCESPPRLQDDGGAVPTLYNGLRDGASSTCRTTIDAAWGFVVGQCNFQLGPTLCPL